MGELCPVTEAFSQTELTGVRSVAFVLALLALIVQLALLIVEIFCAKSKSKTVNKYVHLNN